MLVTVFCAPRDRPETTFALDVSPELELRDFVALCELESGIPAGEIQITYVEQPLKDPTRALGTYGVKDGDVVVLRQADRRPPQTQPAFPGLPRIDFRSITVPGTSSSPSQHSAPQPLQPAPQQPLPPQPRPTQPSTPMAFRGSSPQGLDNPALLQQMLLSNPHELSLLKERNPPLAEALLSGDLERFTKVLLEQQQDRARREQERIRLLTADPFDLEAQAKIEEDIRQHNVEENMTIAMEEAPESFGQVVMLYINCKVNGHPVKAFVDSGAQMTIMSQACAERCNIMRLVDRRWAGIAKGVGTQKIIGRVHLAQVQIEGDFLPCSFSILEDQPMDMLLGLDMLKRHQCSIDLKKNLLIIGTTGTETRFLSEAELPECARLAYGPEGREDGRPEEIADRELAEALQRSIQESDTADGQTTSLQPSPFILPRPLDRMAIPSSSTQSPSSCQSQNPTLDRSQSAPAAVQKAPQLPQPLTPENDASPPHSDLFHPLPLQSESDLSPTPSPTSVTFTSESPDPSGVAPADGVETDQVESSSREECLPEHPMDQGVSESKAAETTEVDSVEMACPADSAEREQPDGDRCSSSDSIPSLAAALKELHELLVQSQNRSMSCSPSHPQGQDSDKPSPEPSTPMPENTHPVPSTANAAAAETSDANANCAADEEPSESPVPDFQGQAERLHEDAAEMGEGLEPLRCPDSSQDREETCDTDSSQPELEVSPSSAAVPEFREPPEGQYGRGVADGQAANTPDSLQTEQAFLSPASAAVSPPQEVSSTSSSSAPLLTQAPPPSSSPAPVPPSPRPFMEQFPAEHIQRIQAAGFSAREAVEALEQAHGVVEIALLALLARSITVPT
ncbi:protein DDI1 homolog 2 isoform X1 [Poeciliopsis prolifica]|uniref:protein DDI1 homolog 2 isoform X1 n=1 Tax=Poeciliopsis prolifica TaxID=188132 RepID=UPI0024134CA0|nr:protein DDI1 homolog 2 isoform X1 [Poeciliopsis prolifica]